MSSSIRGVLFDMGGVLVALDGVPSLAALLGVEACHDALHARWLESPSVIAHETGRIGPAAFAAGVVADLRLAVTPERFLADFLTWLDGPMPGASALLDDVPHDYRVAALSNMSAIHWDLILATDLTRRFDHLFVSHEIGCLKPSDRAFAVALDGMGLGPHEVVFLDDGRRNVEAARALGMEAHVVRGPREARAALVQHGVVPASAGA